MVLSIVKGSNNNRAQLALRSRGTVLLKDLRKTLNLRTHLKLEYNIKSLNYI